MNATLLTPSKPIVPEKRPLLQDGDRLSRDEFHKRYLAMPDLKKAELIEGVVYMSSPVSNDEHGEPHGILMWWLGDYRYYTPGVRVSDNCTVRLDPNNEVQPDAFLRILPERGGQAHTTNGYIEGSPELVAEVSASTASIDSGKKREIYRRNGVREYIIWRVRDREIDWFVLQNGAYEKMIPDPDGLLRSRVFPGLWLDPIAFVNDDVTRVKQALQRGIESPQHQDFVNQLRERQQ